MGIKKSPLCIAPGNSAATTSFPNRTKPIALTISDNMSSISNTASTSSLSQGTADAYPVPSLTHNTQEKRSDTDPVPSLTHNTQEKQSTIFLDEYGTLARHVGSGTTASPANTSLSTASIEASPPSIRNPEQPRANVAQGVNDASNYDPETILVLIWKMKEAGCGT